MNRIASAIVTLLFVATVCADDPTATYRSPAMPTFGGHSTWYEPPGGYEPLPPEIPVDGEYEAVPAIANDGYEFGQPCCPAEVRPFELTQAIGLNVAVTEPLLNFQNRQTEKQLLVLDGQRNVACQGPHAYLGAQFRASFLAAQTNSPNRFSYLGRFPPDFDGRSATDARLVHANQAIVAHVSPWASGYFETLFSDVFTFPTFTQGSWQVRQAYAVVGNFDESPFYGWIGKKNLDFGDFGTLSPFSQAMPWHYFAALAEGVGVGYSDGYVHVTAAAVNAGRGIRVADTIGKGNLSNFTINSRVVIPFNDQVAMSLGAGYLHSTIYDGATAEHTNPLIFGPRNGAWDVNGRLDIGGLSFSGEYVSTLNDWPAVAHKVSAWKAETAYFYADWYKPITFAVSFSEGIQGASGTQFEFNRQLVVGTRIDFSPNWYGTLEWVRSSGFAPLIDITTVSNRDVVQNTAVIGLVLAL